jgi:hypothetical protein
MGSRKERGIIMGFWSGRLIWLESLVGDRLEPIFKANPLDSGRTLQLCIQFSELVNARLVLLLDLLRNPPNFTRIFPDSDCACNCLY